MCGRDADGIRCSVADGAGGFEDSVQGIAAFDDATGWGGEMHNWLSIRFPDLNGDGISDVCGKGNVGLPCGLGVGDGTFGAAVSWSADFLAADGWNTATWWATQQFVDVDGDGSDDVCSRANDGVRCGISNGVDSFGTTTLWADRFANAAGWGDSADHWGTIQFPDVNGDGMHDVCGRNGNGIVCGLSDGESFVSSALWSAQFSDVNGWDTEADEHWGTIQFPDIDGDGAADVCGRNNRSVICRLSNGVDGFDGGSPEAEGFGTADGWDSDGWWGTIEFPDIDGDGNADVCGRSDAGLECALSEGADFGAVALWSDEYSDANGYGDGPEYWATIDYLDLDGDGDEDVCARGIDGLVCAASNGVDGFDDATVASPAFSDTSGWNATESFWRTIQVGTAQPGDCQPNGSYQLPWRTSALPPR